MSAKRQNPDSISAEINMLTDGLQGQLERFNEFNGSNFKMYDLVANMIRTSFKLGYNISRKVRLDK